MASFSNVVSIDLAKVLPDSGQHSTMVAALGSQFFLKGNCLENVGRTQLASGKLVLQKVLLRYNVSILVPES